MSYTFINISASTYNTLIPFLLPKGRLFQKNLVLGIHPTIGITSFETLVSIFNFLIFFSWYP